MQGQQRQHWKQLDLRLPDKSLDKHRKLDQEIRMEVTKLLGLLLSECTISAAETKEASDEQDQR
jgi:hypothetical protein